MATHSVPTRRWLASLAALAFMTLAGSMILNRIQVSAQTQPDRRHSGLALGASPLALAAQPPVRPRSAPSQRPEGPGPSAQAIKGQIRLDAIHRAFKGAKVIITLEKIVGPQYDVRAEPVAELRLFNIYKETAEASAFVPFTFGDFSPRRDTHYNLQCYVDLNGNGQRDVGDYWNQRRVDVLTSDAPPLAIIEDLAPIEAAK